MMEVKVYRLEDVQREINIGVRTLREYVKRGELKARKIGRAYYVSESNFKKFVGGK